MRTAQALQAVLVCAACALASLPTQQPLSSVKRVTNLPVIQNRFIIEVEDAADLPPAKRDLGVHAYLYSELEKRAVGYHVNKEYNSAGLFVGASVTLTDSQDVKAVAQIPGVKAIRPVVEVQRPKVFNSTSVSGPNDPAVKDAQPSHVVTGVDRLHARGITGKGIVVALLDTGVDYNHPALGGGFGPGKKIIGGYDLVGDDYDGHNDPVPDPDPLDTCGTSGHGTHTTGIVGADPNNPFNISGVAYDASLMMFRVFGCFGSAADDVIIDALLLATKSNPHIISMSFGFEDGWSEATLPVVASRIAAQGFVVTISAGNDGADGPWEPSNPSTARDVISVGSSDSVAIPFQSVVVGGASHPPISYHSLFPLDVTGSRPIFATSNDTTALDDACNPLPSNTPDLSNFVVIIRQGGCDEPTKLANVADKGATVALVYDDGSGWFDLDDGAIPGSMIHAEDGEYLVQQFVAGTPITLTFPQSGGIVEVPDPEGGLISFFTSYGPTFDFLFKPAVTAPGGNILSTMPVDMGSYAIHSGTSMAAPFVAGSAALLLSAKGASKELALSARSIFESTATPLSSSHTDGDPLQTTIQQGAGLINVLKSIRTTTVVSPAELILNDTAHFKAVHPLTIKNTGKLPTKYTITHIPAGTVPTAAEAQTDPPVWIPGGFFEVELTKDAAQVTLSETSFTLPPGGSRTITVRFALPNTLDTRALPVFSGFIQVKGGSDTVHASYVGLASSLIDQPTLDTSSLIFGVPLPVIVDSTGGQQTEPTNYTFVDGDFPTVLWRELFGTPALRIDLVDVDTTLPTDANTKTRRATDHLSPFISFPKKPGSGTFQKVKTLGALTYKEFLRRNNLSDNLITTLSLESKAFANGTAIPNGQYRVLVRSLRATGNPNKEEDYDAWLSPIIGVNAQV